VNQHGRHRDGNPSAGGSGGACGGFPTQVGAFLRGRWKTTALSDCGREWGFRSTLAGAKSERRRLAAAPPDRTTAVGRRLGCDHSGTMEMPPGESKQHKLKHGRHECVVCWRIERSTAAANDDFAGVTAGLMDCLMAVPETGGLYGGRVVPHARLTLASSPHPQGRRCRQWHGPRPCCDRSSRSASNRPRTPVQAPTGGGVALATAWRGRADRRDRRGAGRGRLRSRGGRAPPPGVRV
jgi:hypothetical protein